MCRFCGLLGRLHETVEAALGVGLCHGRACRRLCFGGNMKRNQIAALTLIIELLTISAPLFGHHGQSAIDLNKKITLKGTVANFEWVNPHSHFSIDVKDDSGKIQNLTMELSTPLMLQRGGWTKNILKPGDPVI